MNIKTRILKYPENLEECFKVRYEVFVNEQKFDEGIEIDEIDNIAYHVLITNENTPIATARYFQKNDIWKIGRVCVLKQYRNLKLGNVLMECIENHLIELNVDKIYITSQLHAIGFYEKNGFVQEGEIFLEEGCEHKKMYKIIGGRK